MKAVICGGGVAGPALAWAIADSIDSITLLEARNTLPEHDLRGSFLGSEGVRASNELGLERFLMAAKPKLLYDTRREFWHSSLGKIGEYEYSEQSGYPNYALDYSLIVKALYAAISELPNVRVVRSALAHSVEEEPSKMCLVRYSNEETNGEQVETANLVFIAEGTNSLLRQLSKIDAEEVDYRTGFLTIRMTRPTELKTGMDISSPLGFAGVYELPNDAVKVVIELKNEEATQWLHFSKERLESEIGQRIPLLNGSKLVLNASKSYYKVKRIHAKKYHVSRKCLVGDAAHTTMPMLAAGLTLAFNSVRNLADCIRKLGLSDLESTFRCYEERTRPFAQKVLDESQGLYSLYRAAGEEVRRETVVEEFEKWKAQRRNTRGL